MVTRGTGTFGHGEHTSAMGDNERANAGMMACLPCAQPPARSYGARQSGLRRGVRRRWAEGMTTPCSRDSVTGKGGGSDRQFYLSFTS